MTQSEEKNCPRCAAAFVCKAGDITNCQCSGLKISAATQAFLAKTYYACLCKNCLAHYEQLHELAQGKRFPTQREMFVEGLHYYKENGFWVFTELYHFLRGNCCGSGCRHCVYGFVKKG
jgi:hypothetical protein